MASWRRTIEETIDKNFTKVLWAEPLRNWTTFRIGGNAECFIIVNCKDELKKIIEIAHKEMLPIFIIGNGSNLLVSGQGLKGITIKLGNNFSYIKESNKVASSEISYFSLLKVGAATPLSKIIQYALKNSLTGVEFLWGIPATFGGAVISNAGAFFQNIGDIVYNITGILSNGKEITFRRDQLKFNYRQLHLPISNRKLIILEGEILLSPSHYSVIKRKLQEIQQIRKRTQPCGASAGSVFKNPDIAPAGKLIDDCKLKGLKYKDAYISQKHGNFIINRHNTQFNDVYELIQVIKSVVEMKTGIILQEEIEILSKT